MKSLFLTLALLSAGIFIYSSYHLLRQLNGNHSLVIPVIAGFEDVNANDEYNHLLERYKQVIVEHQAVAAKDRTWYFWLSFLVTALTAASTLVSSIQAATTKANDKKKIRKFAILIAILTFCSTLSNFASTHFNELKSEEEKKASDIASQRFQFFTDYNKAVPTDKLAIVRQYASRVDQ